MAKKKPAKPAPAPPADAVPEPAPPEPKKDETPLVSVTFSSAALSLLVRTLNEAKPDGTVEINDLAVGSVRVVVTPKAKKAAK